MTSSGVRVADILLNRKTISVTVSCLVHPLAFLILNVEYDPLPQMPYFFESFTVALVLLVAVSLAASLASDERTVRGLLIVRVVFFLLLSRALGPSFRIERVLILGLILDSVFHAGVLAGSIAGLVCIGLSIAVQTVLDPSPGARLVDHWREVSVFVACGGLWLLLSLAISVALARLTDLSMRLARSEESVASLMDLNVKYQEHVYYVSEKSREEERQRITMDLHDSLSYAMTNIMMMIEAAKYVVRDQPTKTEAHLARIYQQAKEGLDATRATLHDLHDIGPEPVTGLTAVNRVLKDFEMVSGIEIRADYTDTPHSLSRDAGVAVMRFVQEAIANALRHGKATRIRVHFQNTGKGVSITITDNGVGSANVVPGLGLAGMMKRFTDLGGNLETAETKWGFEVRGWIPYGNSRLAGATNV